MADPDLVDGLQTLVEEFARSGVTTLHVRSGTFELLLSNDPTVGSLSQTAQTAAPPQPALAAGAPLKAPPATLREQVRSSDLPADAVIVRAPNLGTFYRAPKPGADDYVSLGAQVAVGQELCLIEVMKLFTAVRAEQAGQVHAVLAEDGAMVEAGQPLFALVAA